MLKSDHIRIVHGKLQLRWLCPPTAWCGRTQPLLSQAQALPCGRRRVRQTVYVGHCSGSKVKDVSGAVV